MSLRTAPRHASITTLLLTLALPLGAQTKPTMEQYLWPAEPLELTSARKADRVAWIAYERGMRNVFTAAAPNFSPVRVTSFLRDDGVDLTDVSLSDDGSLAVFVRGSAPNRVGWIANPSHDPRGGERAIWAARTTGGAAWRIAEGAAPELSPDGRYVLYVKDGQIFRARVAPGAASAVDTGGTPFIKAWGRQSGPRWSPDGSKIAFVSDRNDHSFIAVYDVRSRTVSYVSPSVDCDASPAWASDSKRLAFVRRPGAPFGRQAQEGSGGIGNPPGPAAGRGGAGGCAAGFGGRGGGRGAQEDSAPARREIPGLQRATFRGGYTLSVMVADVSGCPSTSPLAGASGCAARELWHNQPNDRTFATINRLLWGADHVLFPLSPQTDEFDRYYSLDVNATAPTPVLLTTTNGLIEDVTSAALSSDGKTLYYCTNAADIERRHIWAVPVAGGTPRQLSSGEGIETHPTPLPSGSRIAVLSFGVSQPASVGFVPAAGGGGSAKVVFPSPLPKEFPVAAHVTPQIVHVRSPDSLDISNQLFLPKDLKPGERRPAMIFVHGGPPRQMLPGYHYMQFYHWAYSFNQMLANQGYVVLSVNYRSGIGYGRSFRQAPNTNARGNSEYQDVLAAGRYLQTRPDVDPARVGIWGLSYGGLLTAQALARNSDLFIAGIDLAGVHLYGNSLDTTATSYRSSAISEIDRWKSPVMLIHGDDDRNVDFAQTVGLVQLLRARNVYHELIVIPDDLHESMLHSRWVETFARMSDFLRKFVWNKEVASAQ